ncbi:MAG TPA: hypothetical protein VM187_04985 [Niastella sp.]|nr:hypothetical protein [Niastella sp.]
MDTLIEILGWVGSLLVVIAYTMNLNKKMDADSAAYYAMNIAGSGFLIINTAFHHAFPSMVVNIIWVLIPVFTIIRHRSGKKKLARES